MQPVWRLQPVQSLRGCGRWRDRLRGSPPGDGVGLQPVQSLCDGRLQSVQPVCRLGLQPVQSLCDVGLQSVQSLCGSRLQSVCCISLQSV